MRKFIYIICFIAIISCNKQEDLKEDKIIYVPQEVKTIQEAINIANNLDTILVENGEYIENLNLNGKKIYLTSKYYRTLDTLDIASTIIKGNTDRSPIDTKQNSVIRIENKEDSITIDGFTITNGRPQWRSYNDVGPIHLYGGGVYIKKSSATLKNLIIEKNNIQYSNNSGTGGGIYCDSANIIGINLKIRDNLCGGSVGGGGIYAKNSIIYFNNVSIYGNDTGMISWLCALAFDNVQLSILNSNIGKNFNRIESYYRPMILFKDCKGNITNTFIYHEPQFVNCIIDINNCIVNGKIFPKF